MSGGLWDTRACESFWLGNGIGGVRCCVCGVCARAVAVCVVCVHAERGLWVWVRTCVGGSLPAGMWTYNPCALLPRGGAGF